MIYLDNAATTKPDGEAVEKAGVYLNEKYFNPSASYKEGFALQRELSETREKMVAYMADKEAYDLTFTSC